MNNAWKLEIGDSNSNASRDRYFHFQLGMTWIHLFFPSAGLISRTSFGKSLSPEKTYYKLKIFLPLKNVQKRDKW